MIKRLQELREEKGLTYVDIAKITGRSKSSVFNWENGFSSPKAEELIKLADYFKVSVDYLLGRDVDREIKINEMIIELSKLDYPTILEYFRESLKNQDK